MVQFFPQDVQSGITIRSGVVTFVATAVKAASVAGSTILPAAGLQPWY